MIASIWTSIGNFIASIFSFIWSIITAVLNFIWLLLSPIVNGITWVLSRLWGYVPDPIQDFIQDFLTSKPVAALLTVIIGIGAALLVYWLLNFLADLLPARYERMLKPFLFILPAYFAIALYLIYPTILTIINSFRDEIGTKYVGTTNYSDLLGDDKFRGTLFNTFLWILVVPIASVVLGLAMASLTDRLSGRSENFAKTIIFLPMAISLVGASTVWRFIYYSAPAGRPQTGLLNAVVTGLGGKPIPWLQQQQFHINSLLLMVVLLWAQVGFSMVLLSAAIKGVPEDTLEAGRIDGATPVQLFFRIVIPQIRGTIVTVYVTVAIAVMKIFDIVYVMTNGNFNTNVVGNQFFNELNTNFNQGNASAIVVMMLVAVAPIMVFQIRDFRRQGANA